MSKKPQHSRVEPKDLLDSVLLAARAAGDLLLERFGKSLDVGYKSRPADLVTDADRAAEDAVSQIVTRRHPDHSFLAEEGTLREGSLYRWVVDPLDGTVNYAHGIPHWCVSIAVEDEQGPVVGVVHDPMRQETFVATRGGGATLMGAPLANGSTRPRTDLRVTETVDLADAVMATGFAYDPDLRVENLSYLDRMLLRIRGMRRFGSAALDLAWVAAGRFDGYWEIGLERWDIAAGVLLVREAGGMATGFEPGEDPLATGRIVAGGRSVHMTCASIVTGDD